jgi:hypothetical protein
MGGSFGERSFRVCSMGSHLRASCPPQTVSIASGCLHAHRHSRSVGVSKLRVRTKLASLFTTGPNAHLDYQSHQIFLPSFTITDRYSPIPNHPP